MPPEPDFVANQTNDPWSKLRATTNARIGLGRIGDAMPIRDVLDFQLAHAKARDAVHARLDVETLRAALEPPVIVVRSEATSREQYLRRPDLGRRLHPDCRPLLIPGDYDAVFVIADGLSATAVAAHAIPTLNAVRRRLANLRIAPIVIATQARVAIGDDIGEALNARLCAILIGERPGLSVAESLGIYLTYAPRRGCRDCARNCISNIHTTGGLAHDAAADTLAWLIHEALHRQLTGVGLKEDAQGVLPPTTRPLASGSDHRTPSGASTDKSASDGSPDPAVRSVHS
ncbi:ethanolamine ammonia-lyase subunit EutC [Acidiphilium sp. PA]|uniref:ethanolamine ammonia-lyase subunit EutC n=1 Tax=Acidiphilium sp. PA TaxID=2871705 RepID=UPI0022441B08|nr:ethanolamine ammonia-lyase subunit EutC [Acidiphilium sp. PA]MCW8307087.1 ethanolamine ammonia-lyase subunit EutC [Acidiphilium sp. PA]